LTEVFSQIDIHVHVTIQTYIWWCIRLLQLSRAM